MKHIIKKCHPKQGIALILTLGIIFMLGIIVGSFAFFTSTANKNTKTYASVVNATNFADAGYQYMLGAIHDYFERILSTIQSEAPLVDSEPYRISSERFNKIQSTLAAYLEGKTVSFQSSEWNWLASEVSPGIQASLDAIMFGSGDSSLGYDKSWTDTFNLGRIVSGSGLEPFHVDLDGINNYNYDELGGLSEWDYAQSILNFVDPTAPSTTVPSALDFSENNVDNEIRDANWHEFRDEFGNLIGRFAVMAKDQSSLVNLQTNLGDDALGEITNQLGGITREEIDEAALTSPEFGVENLITQYSDSATASGLKEMYTTTSVNAAKTIDLNSSELTDFFMYLNEDSRNSTDPNLNNKMAANAKIAVNLEDFTDADSIPSVLTRYNWSSAEISELNPWAPLSNSDIFFGIEGVRISEVMVQPEQSYMFGSNVSPLRFSLTAGSLATFAPDNYFYQSSFATTPGNRTIAEILEEDGAHIKVSPDWTFSYDDSQDTYLQLSSYKNPSNTHESFRIRNPGGPYQVWLKMKITATGPAMDDTAITNLQTLSTKTEPDAIVIWASAATPATTTSIKDSSIVIKLSSTLEASLATIGGTDNDDYLAGALTLARAEAIFPTEFAADDFLIIADPSSTLSQVRIDGTSNNQRMNFPSDKDASNPRPVVDLNWGDEKGIVSSNTEVLNYLNNKLASTSNNTYPFGSRVVEVALFDVTDTEVGVPKDELIGVFYCVNTNGFKEDDAAIASGDWPSVDDDYLWFYSVGIPEWTSTDEMPSWIKLMTDAGEFVPLGPGAIENEKYNYNKNLCVFPRSDCNLKIRFRLVNMQDSRFNGGNTPNYKLGIDSLTMDGQNIDQTTDLTTVNELQQDLSIVGRPQWNDGDSVEIEIKEMVLTQQVYDTGLKKRTFNDSSNPANNKYIANTYNFIEDTDPQLLQLYELPPLVSNPSIRDPSLNKSIYFRNQRLENRAANENHQAEYIEIYNGNSKPVDMDGWVLKIEQYKLVDGEYELLGPARPNSFIDPSFDLFDGDLLNYSPRSSISTGIPDYIYIHNTTIPGNTTQATKSELPFAVVTNGLNYVTFNSNGELMNPTYTSYLNNQFTEPLSFENAYNIALGEASINAMTPSSTSLPGDLYLNQSTTLPEIRTQTGNIYTYHVETPTGVTVPAHETCPLRTNPTGSSASTNNWYSLNSSGWSEKYQYETFNLVSGIVVKRDPSTTGYCDAFKIDNPSNSFHKRDYYDIYISGNAMTWTTGNQLTGLPILDILKTTSKNPFTEVVETYPQLATLFAPEISLWDDLVGYAASETNSSTFAQSYSEDYKRLMLPVITDISSLPTGLAVEVGQWKYDAITALNSQDSGGLKTKVKLLNTVWKHATLIVEFNISTGRPSFPEYNSQPDYATGYASSTTDGTDSAYIQNTNAHYATRADLLFPWRFPDGNKDNPNGVGSTSELRTLFQEYSKGLFPSDSSVSGTAKSNLIYTNVLGETEYNYTPNNFDFPIVSSSDPRTVSTSSDIVKRTWAFIPVRFHAARPQDTQEATLFKDTFNINLNAAWNYLSPQEIIYATTVNLHKEMPGTGTFVVNPGSKTVLQTTAGTYFANVQGVNPLHLRDDADRIVVSLFAPNSLNRISTSNLDDARELVYTDGLGSRTYGSTVASFGLIEEKEWLSGNRAAYTSGNVNFDPEFYSLIDRAVIDRTILNDTFRAENPSAPAEGRYDWRGNRAVRLKTFFTDPHLLRQGFPGSLSNLTPFSNATEETRAQACASYWETHPPVFKVKPGPIGDELQFVLEAYGSPGIYNFRHNQIDKSITSLVTPVDDYFLELDKSLIAPTLLQGNTPAEREMRSLDVTDSYTDNILGTQSNYIFYNYLRTGFSNFDHRILPYPENGFFIKNGPLTSISELCDVPAPNIENAVIGQNPLTPDSLINGFVDGEETVAQYFSEEQKRKVFSGTSTDGTVLSPSNSTELTFDLSTYKAYSNEDTTSNPITFNYDTSNPRAIRLQYTFLCAGNKRHFNPGRYKILMSGIDPAWDVFSLITIVSDVRNSARSNDPGLIQRAGGALIQLSDPALQSLTKDQAIQIISSGGEEFFNVQERIEINFFVDPTSDILTTNYASNPIQKINPTDISLLEAITQSVAFGHIKFLLIPQASTGKVNINTAPLQTLLRLPGFMHAIDPKNAADGHQTMTQDAAREILIDILETRDPTNGGRAFTDAGDLLVASTPGVMSATHRIFPVNASQVLNDLTDPTGLRGNDLLKEQMAREKLRIFREVLPYIQFAGHSFEIVSLGQSLKTIGNTNRILSSSKVTATVNLKNLLKDLSRKYVKDFWDVAEEVEAVGDDSADDVTITP